MICIRNTRLINDACVLASALDVVPRAATLATAHAKVAFRGRRWNSRHSKGVTVDVVIYRVRYSSREICLTDRYS
jgi:hypothetical protein